MKKSILCAFALLFSLYLNGQQLPGYSQYFLNPYVYNPAMVGLSGYNEVYAIHRRQWVGVEGAPVTSNLTIHLPTAKKLAYGISIVNDSRGLLTNTSALFTIGYSAKLGKDQYLRAGLSGGLGMNALNMEKVENYNDPALAKYSNNNLYFDGNLGVNYQLKNFNVGVSLPKVFHRSVVQTNQFNQVEIKRLDYYLITSSYRFNLSDGAIAIEPQFIYRAAEGVPSRFDVGAAAFLHDRVWFGGTYRQNNGPAAFAGFKINETMRFSYAYELTAKQMSGFSNSTHELVIGLRFGKQKRQQKPSTASQKSPAVRKTLPTKDKELSDEQIEKQLNTIPNYTPAQPNKGKENPENKKTEPTTDNSEVIIVKGAEIRNAAVQEEKLPEQKQAHPLELEKGHYVVVNAFRIFDNAVNYHERLSDSYQYCQFGYSSKSMLYYTHLLQTTDLNRARLERNKMRKVRGFEKAWVLTIE